MFVDELRQRAVVHPIPDFSNTRFVDVSSVVVPGMMYHWGIYSPPLRPEVHFTALVAERNGALLLISMPSDWIDAAGEFIPQSVDDVMLACREMIQTTTLPRSPNQPIVIYRNDESLNRLPLAVPDTAYLRETLTTPHITGNPGHGWQARFWALQRRTVREYECKLGNNGGLFVVDSLPGYGFY